MYKYCIALTVLLIAILAFKTAGDVLEQLGLSARAARQHILDK
ncbi:hypothetical protein [Niabella sp.]|nr:hypothetical protein [Niabella sp.]